MTFITYTTCVCVVGRRMELRRVKCLKIVPSPIRCVQFSDHPTTPKLAVSRSNGTIEVWCTKDGSMYYQDIFIPGRTDCPVESIIWHDDGVVAAGFSGHLDRWDLQLRRPAYSYGCEAGPIWCMGKNPVSSDQLAVGAENGTVQIFTITSSGFVMERLVHRQQSRVLCLAWHSSGEYIVFGGTEGTLKVVHLQSGTIPNTFNVENCKEQSIAVWDVKFLGDASLVSASSSGSVQIWDFKTATLQSSFNMHAADVLSLANQERDSGRCIFASGVDSVMLKISSVMDETGESIKWIPSGKIRPHQYDVFSLHASKSGMLASGGVEGELVITNLRSFNKRSYVKYQPFSSMERNFGLAEEGNVLLYQDASVVNVWCTSNTILDRDVKKAEEKEVVGSKGDIVSSPQCVFELRSKPPHNLLSSAISSDGSFIAVSNVFEVWVYYYDKAKRKLSLTNNFNDPSCAMIFTPTAQPKLLLATTSGNIKRVSFAEGQSLEIDVIASGQFKKLELSSDNQYLAAIPASWRVHIFHVDINTCVAKLPLLPSLPIALTFNPMRSELIVYSGGDGQQLYVYNFEEQKLRSLGAIGNNEFFNFRPKLSQPLSLFPVSSERDLYCIYDNDSMSLIRINNTNSRQKRRKTKSTTSISVQRLKTEASVLFAGNFHTSQTDSGLVLIEIPRTDILQSLPPALHRKRFGI